MDFGIGIVHELQGRLEDVDGIEPAKLRHGTFADAQIPLHQDVRITTDQIDRFFAIVCIVVLLVVQRTFRTHFLEEAVIGIVRQRGVCISRSGRFEVTDRTEVRQLLDVRNHHGLRTSQTEDRLSRCCIAMRIDVVDHVTYNGRDLCCLLSPEAISPHNEQCTAFNRFQPIVHPRNVAANVHVQGMDGTLLQRIVANVHNGHILNILRPIDVHQLVEIVVGIFGEFDLVTFFQKLLVPSTRFEFQYDESFFVSYLFLPVSHGVPLLWLRSAWLCTAFSVLS